MKTVLLRGPFLTMSGYGVHARQLAKWVLAKPDLNVIVAPLPWGNTPWFTDRDGCDGLIGQLMDRSMPQTQKADVSLQLQLPNEWDPNLANYNVGLTAGVETTICNPRWVEACNRMSQIVVPSKHTEMCFKASGQLTTKLSVVSESYNPSIDELAHSASLPRFSTNFNFLIFGQLTGNSPLNDRKNILNTIKYLCDVFNNDPDVGLVLKINTGRDTKIDKDNVHNLVKKIVAEVRKGEFPRIHVLHGRLTDDENAALMKHEQIKALVTLTRGEGFGLPILDAAASGLPVIATSWSGHLDFLTLGKYIPVSYSLMPVHQSRIDNEIFVPGSLWAEASESDFKKRVKKFRESPELPKQWATELAKNVKEKFSQAAIETQYDNLFKGVLC